MSGSSSFANTCPITAQPCKRPRSSYTRFELAQPNEMWQSDFIYWRLQDDTDVGVLTWLDDHSRFPLSWTAHQPVTGDDVVSTFLAVIDDHGAPASTLTDNGRVYTARFGGGRNAFEYLRPAQQRTRPRPLPPALRPARHHRQDEQRARPLAELSELRPMSRDT